jgi:hypothetical protein
MGIVLKRKKNGSATASDDDSDDSDDEKPKAKNGPPPAVPFPLLKAAILKYKEIYGHMVISAPFIVPCIDPWPDEMWGIKLGALSKRIRSKGGEGGYREHRAELVRINR